MGVRSIKMPDVGEGVAEAEIVEWAVKVGDLVSEDQVVAAVMTDKATVEIPTPGGGQRARAWRRGRGRAGGRRRAHSHRRAWPAGLGPPRGAEIAAAEAGGAASAERQAGAGAARGG